MFTAFKKLAGTSAVFIAENYVGAAPLERDGLVWTASELHADRLCADVRLMPAMANALALEGLEEYEPPCQGDVRRVNSLGVEFVYVAAARAWVQFA